jgi:hypothetical protein
MTSIQANLGYSEIVADIGLLVYFRKRKYYFRLTSLLFQKKRNSMFYLVIFDVY